MKIRLALNSNFASRKIKGAAYGILLLLTFFVPQFANTQDKLDAAKPAQTADVDKPPAEPAVGAEPKTSDEKAVSVPASGPARLTDVKISSEGGYTAVVITADQPVTPQKFRLNNPPRLVLDFPDSRNAIKGSPFTVNDSSIKQLRVNQFQDSPSMIARMVFDLQMGSETPEVSVEQNQVKVSFGKPQEAYVAAAAESDVKPADDLAKQPAWEEPPVFTIPEVPEIASFTTPETLPETAVTAPEIAEFSALPVETVEKPDDGYSNAVEQASEPVETQPALIAALAPTALPTALSFSESGSRFTGYPLSVDVVNMPLTDFFRLMADEGGINIVLDPTIKDSTTLKVVKMPWDQVFDAVLKNHGLDKKIEGNLVRVASKATLQEEAKQEEALKKASLLAADLETRVKQLNYAKASDLKTILAEQKTARGTVVVYEQTNSLILTDLPDSIDKQVRLIESLDIPQPQVEIDTRIVSATRNFARDIGVQFGFLQGNNQRVTAGGSNTPLLKGGDRPGSGTSSDGAGVSTGDSGNGNLNVNLPARTPFGGIGIAVGNIFDTFLLDAAITAGESKGWAKLISQPKVVAQNNTQAVITNGVSIPVPVMSDNTLSIQFFDAALSLTATPQITYEGNIVLDLKLSNNTADFGHTAMNGVPTIRKSETSTRITVSDGGTTVLSGIIVDETGNNEDKVPGLGSLPILGNLFRRTGTLRDSQEIMFFVTPHIIK